MNRDLCDGDLSDLGIRAYFQPVIQIDLGIFLFIFPTGDLRDLNDLVFHHLDQVYSIIRV